MGLSWSYYSDDLNQNLITTVVLTAAINNTLTSKTSSVQLDMAFSSCVGKHTILKGMPGEATAAHYNTSSELYSTDDECLQASSTIVHYRSVFAMLTSILVL